LSLSSNVLLLAKTITHPAARSLCDSWASCSNTWLLCTVEDNPVCEEVVRRRLCAGSTGDLTWKKTSNMKCEEEESLFSQTSIIKLCERRCCCIKWKNTLWLLLLDDRSDNNMQMFIVCSNTDGQFNLQCRMKTKCLQQNKLTQKTDECNKCKNRKVVGRCFIFLSEMCDF